MCGCGGVGSRVSLRNSRMRGTCKVPIMDKPTKIRAEWAEIIGLVDRKESHWRGFESSNFK